MKKNKLSLTIGIPTYYGGPGLVQTVRNILVSKGVDKFRLIVSVDANPLKPNIAKQLKELGIEIINNKKRGGQVTRILQIISLCKTEFIILTQDDILFTPYTIKAIMEGFREYPHATMLSGKVIPLKPNTFIEKVVHIGVSISYTIGKNWKNGDNYFLAGGRCLAFRTKMAKKLKMPEEVLNSDTYLYFLNKKLGGSFRHIPLAIYHMRSPQTLSEHMKQSKKYQHVPAEIKHYLELDINKIQSLPLWLQVYASIKEFIKKPILTICYLGILLYTRTQKKNMYKNVTRYWDTDISTKKIS